MVDSPSVAESLPRLIELKNFIAGLRRNASPFVKIAGRPYLGHEVAKVRHWRPSSILEIRRRPGGPLD